MPSQTSGAAVRCNISSRPISIAPGQSGVTLAFYSSYEQNQDNIGAVEYSVDEGASWLPIAYLIEGPDIVRNQDGTIDAETTLNASHGEAATYTDELGEFHGGTYGSFIAAPIGPRLGTVYSGSSE